MFHTKTDTRTDMTNPCATYDFTIPEYSTSKEMIEGWLKENCKRWCFQLEEGEETGYLHYQGRISLKNKKRLIQLCNEFTAAGFKGHLSVTSLKCKSNFFYVTKEETRKEGPWADDTTMLTMGIEYIPKQIREMRELRPFQKSIIASAKVWDPRSINVLLDKRGNMGKSLLKGYMRAHKIARCLPYANDFKDIMRMVCDMPTSQCYVIDMPRALTKNHLEQFFGGMEEIKNGYAYDDRYHFKEKHFDSPAIWIFCNVIPDLRYLTTDRWKFWWINNDYELISYPTYQLIEDMTQEVQNPRGCRNSNIPIEQFAQQHNTGT